MKVSAADMEKVSYIKVESFDDRVIPMQPCYLGESNWEAWILTEKGLLPMKMIDVADACYFSKEPAKATDIHIGFISLIMKRAYFKDLVHFENGIQEDINNLSASVTKINLFHEIWRSDNKKITRRFVTTEMEYIFKVCRSLFDLLQEVIMKIWSRFKYIDPNLTTKKLKPTFSKMVFLDNKLSTAEEVAKRFQIPMPLAEFYTRNGVFFSWLRSYRDKISHGGNSIKSLYIMDDGFAISTDTEPFADLHIWKSSDLKANGLGSVRSVVSYAILNTLHALEDFSSVIQSIIQLPPDVAPDHEVYIRGENLEVLLELHKYIEGEAWVKI
ncbi:MULTISPECIES: hypothetical protein [unclassified Pseudoalteromonas]|uniref:hypothetical protein n=1 Tax=Pseudoalteromonas sp. RB2-MNA-CIBAN-0110 TaxID=3140439 RepID=UPI00041756EB|nr:hypothetical protein [Pseudoalteromonas sp. TB13]